MPPFGNGLGQRTGNKGISLFHPTTPISHAPAWKPDPARFRQAAGLTRAICFYILICTYITGPGGLSMGSTVFDSVLFRDMFGTAEMRAVFADEALIARYIEAEVALARAQARLGVVPETAADAIAVAARAIKIDVEKLRRETEIVGYPILP